MSTKNESFIMVSTEWANKMALRAKRWVYRQRIKKLKQFAEFCLATPRFVFFGKKRTFTKKQLHDKMREIWINKESDLEFSLGEYRYFADIMLDRVKSIIEACSLAENGVIFLSLEDVSTLKKFDKND